MCILKQSPPPLALDHIVLHAKTPNHQKKIGYNSISDISFKKFQTQ